MPYFLKNQYFIQTFDSLRRVYTLRLCVRLLHSVHFGNTYVGFHKHISMNQFREPPISKMLFKCRKQMHKWDVATWLNLSFSLKMKRNI